jgi:spermidine/putrescine-binding protein
MVSSRAKSRDLSAQLFMPKYIFLILTLLFGINYSFAETPKKLNIYIWSDYLSDEIIQSFTKKTGIKVQYDTYDSNEALLEKLQSGVSDYDLVVPSDYMVKILISENLVQPLDRKKIKNFQNLDPRFLNKKFDPENKYSMPYFWGTTGIGYNKQKITEPLDSWDAMFNPKYSQKILMLDDMRECFAVALRRMKKSINERDPETLKKAAQMLKDQKKLVKTYNSADFSNILKVKDVDLAHGYNGQIAEVVMADPKSFAFVVPKEGGTFWMDNLCLTAKSKNAEAAYIFLNHILEPEVGAEIVNKVRYASANVPAKKFINPEIINNPIIYPGDDIMKRCEFMEDLGETTTLLDQYWTEIKAQ